MKIIEKPVGQIENASDLREVASAIVPLMKSLKHIFDSSNFYKEARMVSFLDRLMQILVSKIRERVNLNRAIEKGKKDLQEMMNTHFALAKAIISKYQEVNSRVLNCNRISLLSNRCTRRKNSNSTTLIHQPQRREAKSPT